MISPLGYAKSKREDIMANVSTEWADLVLNRSEPELVLRTLEPVPRCIPQKYHARMQNMLLTAYLRALFEQASYKYTVAQRHRFIQQVFENSRNSRES